MSDYARALLGAVLAGYRDVPGLLRLVSRADFGDPRLGHIWQTAVDLHAAGTPPNPLAVLDAMGSAAHKLPGGATFLSDLAGEAPFGADPEWLAGKVREESIRRQVADLGVRCQQIVSDPDTSPDDLVAKIRAWSDEVGTVNTGELTDVRVALEQVIDTAQHGEPRGSHLPWPALEDILGGFHPGQLVTVGAESGAGKSLALENIATYTARSEKCWVLFVSLEMSSKEISQRTLAYTAGVDLTHLRKGGQFMSPEEWARVNAAHEVIADTRIKFAEQPSYTVAAIRAAASDAAMHAKRMGERLGMIVVDYIQMVTTTASDGDSRQQKLGGVSRGLKRLAREFDVTVVTAAQLNRAPGVPTMASLRESADIGNDSDIVLLLHEDRYEENGRVIKTGEVAAIVAKNRGGPTGAVTLQKVGHRARLVDPSAREDYR